VGIVASTAASAVEGIVMSALATGFGDTACDGMVTSAAGDDGATDGRVTSAGDTGRDGDDAGVAREIEVGEAGRAFSSLRIVLIDIAVSPAALRGVDGRGGMTETCHSPSAAGTDNTNTFRQCGQLGV